MYCNYSLQWNCPLTRMSGFGLATARDYSLNKINCKFGKPICSFNLLTWTRRYNGICLNNFLPVLQWIAVFITKKVAPYWNSLLPPVIDNLLVTNVCLIAIFFFSFLLILVLVCKFCTDLVAKSANANCNADSMGTWGKGRYLKAFTLR